MNLPIINTGVDHLYPNGVPVAESLVLINAVYKKVERRTSLAVLADPYFTKMPAVAKQFSELHSGSNRIAEDFMMEGLSDIMPIFTPMQRWMHSGALVDDATVENQTFLAFNLSSFLGGSSPSQSSGARYLNFELGSTYGENGIVYKFEYNSLINPGFIVVRWLIQDTRTENFVDNYTSITNIDIRNDLNMVANVNKYLKDALAEYILAQFYRTIGYDKKYLDHKKEYESNRRLIAFWAKNDTSLQTQYHNNAGL